MADQTTQKPTNATAGFNPSPNALSAENFNTIRLEREELVKKQLNVDNEFMHQHYERLIKAADVSFERASKANLIFERRQRRATARQRRETLHGQTGQRPR